MSLNRMLRAHWQKRRGDLESWRWHIRRVLGTPRNVERSPLAPKAHLRIVVHRARQQDPDNAQASVKHLLDALVREGWLEDDSPEHVSLEVAEVVERRRKSQRTVVSWLPDHELPTQQAGVEPFPTPAPATSEES